MEDREQSLRHRLGVTDDSAPILVFEQSAHCDWDWVCTHLDYYLHGSDAGNSVIDILSAAFVQVDAASTGAAAADPYAYTFCEVGYLRDFLDSIDQKSGDTVPLPTRRQWQAAAKAGRFSFSSGGITSADNLLSHREAFIRNYLIGRQWVLDTFGVDASLQMWIPDDFGHDAQLPVLLEAMGFLGAGFWRIPAQCEAPKAIGGTVDVPGMTYQASAAENAPSNFLSDRAAVSSVDFVWAARDGSQIQAHWLAGSYGQGNQLGGDASIDVSKSAAQIQKFIDFYHGLTPANYLFVPIDNDFTLPYTNLPAVINAWNDRRGTGTTAVTLATFADFMALVSAADADRQCLPRLKSNPTDASTPFLPHPYYSGCYSSSPAIKRMHHRCVRLLLETEADELVLEYLATRGGAWPAVAQSAREQLAQAWDRLVPSTHHDYITGTSPNDVSSTEQEPRLEQAVLDASRTRLFVQQELARAITAPTGIPGTPVALFNPVGLARDGLAEITVPDAETFNSCTVDGVTFTPVQAVAADRLLTVTRLPALGYRSGCLDSTAPTTSPQLSALAGKDEFTLQNDRLRAIITTSGIVGLYDLRGANPERNLFGTDDGTPSLGNVITHFQDSGTIYRFGSEQVLDPMIFQPIQGVVPTAVSLTQLEDGPIRVSVQVSGTLTFPSGPPTVPFDVVYRLVVGEPFLRMETTSHAPDQSVVCPGCSVIVSFPFGAATPITELVYGTTAHWDRRRPRHNFLSWTAQPTDSPDSPPSTPSPSSRVSGAPPDVQDITFEPTHDYVMPLTADGTALGAIYHASTPGWAISLDGGSLDGCILRNAPSGGQAAQGTDVATHTQIYAVRVPSGLAMPGSGCGHGTPFGEALLHNNPATGMPIPADTSATLPTSMSIAATTSPTAIITAAKAGTVHPHQMILRLYQPTDTNLDHVEVEVDPLIAAVFQDAGILKASAVTALEVPLTTGQAITTTNRTLALTMPHALATVALDRP